jgi:superfamily II DNA or RNA helicase
VDEGDLQPGLYERLVTRGLAEVLSILEDGPEVLEVRALRDADAADRLTRHLGRILQRAMEAMPEEGRAKAAAKFTSIVIDAIAEASTTSSSFDAPADPVRLLEGVWTRNPDGSPAVLAPPLTPLLDTTLLTNSRGEPSLSHELRAEVQSSDSIDLVMAFIRWSGIRPLLDALERHCRIGKPLRVVTTTYTNSTELRALDELKALGAKIKVSYDTSSTRLHAKAWLFNRKSGFSTAYIGSSNLSHSAMATGLEWNVRVAGATNPDVLAKMQAVFDTYWESGDFVDFERDEFVRNTAQTRTDTIYLSPVEILLMPFQERLLEQVELARSQDHHRNLLVAATGTGKTVMAAVDFARLREQLPRDRLLFVAHRRELLDQSRATFAQALREPSFGELWVSGEYPTAFEHVFASIQSLNRSELEHLDRSHFDVVIVDEFHHAAAPSYRALLDHVSPRELLGLTATPERSDGLDILSYFDGRIAAELRVWDAIDQQYLVPFSYFGIYDGSDLSNVPWRRGRGYEPNELANVLTGDDVWINRVIEQVRDKIGDPGSMKALGFCVSIGHAQFMAERFAAAGVPAAAIWGDNTPLERANAIRDLASGAVNIVFTVDLFNEGIDVPNVDTLLLVRPTESGTLFLQQLGRGLRRAHGKAICTVLDFVGNHRREFRFDIRLRALLGGSRRDIERQVQDGFPFLPAGCNMELDSVASEVVLRSIKLGIPSRWRDQCNELRRLGDVSLSEYLEEADLELEDIYAGGRSWTELRRAVGLPTEPAGPDELALLRAVGRLLHVDDKMRLAAYRSLVEQPSVPDLSPLSAQEKRYVRMLVGSITTLRTSALLSDGLEQLWQHKQVLRELAELFSLLPDRIDHLHQPVGIEEVPLMVHARYTRSEILAAFDVGEGVKPPTWQTGVWWEGTRQTDLLAFTLDKSAASFSPTTRYRDYAISPELIHWESQAATSLRSDTGQRYVNQGRGGTRVLLFARLQTSDRAFWCLGQGSYVTHTGERPIAVTWRLRNRLPGDLFADFAAAVA